jgi:hypothetical protein
MMRVGDGGTPDTAEESGLGLVRSVGQTFPAAALTSLIGDDLRELARGPQGEHVVGAGNDDAAAAGDAGRDRVRGRDADEELAETVAEIYAEAGQPTAADRA